MLKEIKLPLNTSILELATVSFFIAVGYSVIYKYSFYNELGIEWYVYSLSPNFIILSSVKMLFTLLLGLFLGLFIFMKVKNIKKVLIHMFILMFFMTVYFVVNYFKEDLFFSKRTISLFFVGILLVGASKYCLIGYADSRNLKDDTDDTDDKEKNMLIIQRYFFLTYIVFVIFLILSVPASLGMGEARELKKNFYNLDRVILKENNSTWKLLDLNGDKLLLVANTSEEDLAFKIVEYKDVDSIVESKD